MSAVLEGFVVLSGLDQEPPLRDLVVSPMRLPDCSFVALTAEAKARLMVGAQDGTAVPPFLELTTGVVRRALEASWFGPVLYLHLESFGGEGTQEVLGWEDGEQAFAPIFTRTRKAVVAGHYQPSAPADSAINQGLRWFGVQAGTRDEFVTVGLDLHPFTEDWAGL